MARRKIIAGNWKMNMTPTEAKALVETLKPLVDNPDVDVVYCVPAIDIVPVVEAVKGYMKHEENVLTKITELRTSWANVSTTSEKIELDNQLSGALKTIMAVSENPLRICRM